MGVLSGLLGWIVGDLFTSLFARVVRSSSTTADRRSFDREGRVRCAVRAVNGRVLNIGTEWSLGSAVVSGGHVMFTPSMGIVGVRSIDILALRPDSRGAVVIGDVGTFEGTSVVVDTAKGELQIAFPSIVFDDVVGVLGLA
jgi:hypothetical protein